MIDPFAKLRPDFVQALRPDLEQRYRECLGCHAPLDEPAERRAGLHATCEPGYRVGARFLWPGEEGQLDRVGIFVCAGCGRFFVARGKDHEFQACLAEWTRDHARCGRRKTETAATRKAA